ncbi:MAG: hypothetical protein J7K37_00760 [Candidatus Omnitrophica bacterium]|nr:hypothetical protein [Candidatus Omnitrophota bacterium]
MEKIFKRYKNFFLTLGILFVLGLFLVRLYNFYETRIANYDRDIEELRQKIELLKSISFYQNKFSQIKGNFLSSDSYTFIDLVSDYVRKAGLEVVSIEPESKVFYEEKEIIFPLVLKLSLKGGFDNLLNFLEILDEEKLKITVLRLEISENISSIALEILGLALEEVKL